MKTSTPKKTTPSLNKDLSILILEDEPNDVILIKNELKKLTLPHKIRAVENREDFLLALRDFKPDIILADYFLPMFTGMDALKLARGRFPHIPFVLVTGSINEETAVECIKAGADDYILKNHLERLGGAIRNVLERKRAQEALRESDERYRSLFENMLEGYAYCRMLFENDRPQDFTYLNVNSAFEKLTGLKNVIGRKVTEVIPGIKESNPELFEIYGRVALIGSPERFETYLDALGIWLSISVFSPGKGYFVAVFDNITERKRAEEALRKSEERYRTLAEAAHDLIYIINRQGEIEYCNEFAARQFNLKPEEMTGKKFSDFFPPQISERQKQSVQRVFESGQPFYIEGEAVYPRGITWIGTWLVPLADQAGKVNAVMGVSRDITERKRAEEALRESEEKFAKAFRSSPDIIVLTSLTDGRIVEVNDNLQRMTGYAHDEIIGKTTAELRFWANSADRERYTALLRQDGRVRDMEAGFRIKSGEIRDTLVSGEIIQLRDGKYILGVIRDITERKRAEEKIKLGEEKLHKSFLGIIRTIALITELRDPYTAGHQRRVTDLACAIAQEIGFTKEQIEALYAAGVLHDMGKINVPSEILSKPGRLSDLEYNLVKTHVKAGYDILKDIEFPWPVAEVVLQHHERMDGSGYPSGLTGERIHMNAKILAVADVVEAMSSYRPYRPGLGIDKALEEISQNKGILYDAGVVDVCLKVFAEKGFKLE